MNNQHIACIVDSGSDVAESFVRAHDIFVVPQRITYSDGSTYESCVNISSSEILTRLDKEIPTTSLPSPDRIHRALVSAREAGYTKAVIFTIASKLSATYETMRMVADQMSDFPTLVIDTRLVGMVSGMVVERAVELIEQGTPFEALEEKIEAYIEHSRVFFCAKTLDYVYKGGRINAAIYNISKVLNIKPILTCDESGAYAIKKKARGWDKALDTLVALVEDYANRWGKVRIAICTTEKNRELFEHFNKRLQADIKDVAGIEHADITPELLVHTGPDLIGLGIQKVLDN